jgi:hypothetical protein
VSKEEIPYLILAEDNKVILQDMTEVVIKGPDTVLSRNSQNNLIKGNYYKRPWIQSYQGTV